jgi:hypothetical protein
MNGDFNNTDGWHDRCFVLVSSSTTNQGEIKMKSVLSSIVAALVALSFAGIVCAAEPAAAPAAPAAAAPAADTAKPAKPAKKKKAKKAPKKDAAAPAADAAPAAK